MHILLIHTPCGNNKRTYDGNVCFIYYARSFSKKWKQLLEVTLNIQLSFFFLVFLWIHTLKYYYYKIRHMAPDLWEHLLSSKGRNSSPENTCTIRIGHQWKLRLEIVFKTQLSLKLWRTGKPGILQSTWSQTVGHDLATEQQQHLGIHEIREFYFKRPGSLVRIWTLYELANAASQTIPKFWD